MQCGGEAELFCPDLRAWEDLFTQPLILGGGRSWVNGRHRAALKRRIRGTVRGPGPILGGDRTGNIWIERLTLQTRQSRCGQIAGGNRGARYGADCRQF